MDLTKLTKDELLQQVLKIQEELNRRDRENFPYEVGQCFYKVAPSSMGHGIETCKIESLTSTVNVIMLVFDACNNSHRYVNSYSYNEFMKTWKVRISDRIFDLYKNNVKRINDLNRELVNNVIQLSKEYDSEGN